MSDPSITTGVADVGVPFFVSVMLLLSYLLWAKFLHGGRLRIDLGKPDSVDAVASVVLIFSSLLLTFLELHLAYAAFSAIHDLDLSVPRLSNIWTAATTAVVILGCLAIVVMLGAFLGVRSRQSKIPHRSTLLAELVAAPAHPRAQPTNSI
jgi:hypothetical protein